jgi:hypothetical protein
LRERKASDERTNSTDRQRPPEDDAGDAGRAAVPCQGDGAEGEDDAAGGEDIEWGKSEQYPQRGDEEDSDEECCQSGSSGS